MDPERNLRSDDIRRGLYEWSEGDQISDYNYDVLGSDDENVFGDSGDEQDETAEDILAASYFDNELDVEIQEPALPTKPHPTNIGNTSHSKRRKAGSRGAEGRATASRYQRPSSAPPDRQTLPPHCRRQKVRHGRHKRDATSVLIPQAEKRRGRMTFECKECGVPLCIHPCFEHFHTKNKF
ncbi:hypothetical protein J6590_099378 [Homalodisca vitripennis]|nr:hypothetical protein J6590_099378 [Homalodisca vitripennis]